MKRKVKRVKVKKRVKASEEESEEEESEEEESEEEETFDPRVTSNQSVLALGDDGSYYCMCNKGYKHRAGYYRHKKKCIMYQAEVKRYSEYVKSNKK